MGSPPQNTTTSRGEPSCGGVNAAVLESPVLLGSGVGSEGTTDLELMVTLKCLQGLRALRLHQAPNEMVFKRSEPT